MFPPFPQESARHYCVELISDIKDNRIKITRQTPVSQERQNDGFMLGSLVCTHQETKERIVLHAISGISKQLTTNDKNNPFQYKKNGQLHIIVPPVADNRQIEIALSKNDKEIHELTAQINDGNKELIPLRTKLCDESLRKVFNLYTFTSFNGKKMHLKNIIESNNNQLPPTGTGDCSGPKLLSYAFENKLQPISMDEVFYNNNSSDIESFPPCDIRCKYILPHILGLEILYQDKDIVVVNKQSGLLAVPGRGEEKLDSVETRLKILFPQAPLQPAVHRLDMETSGLMILALNAQAHRNLNRQFEEGLVHKKYEALLDGILEKSDGDSAPPHGIKTGTVSLKFRLDPDNRPHQIYDEVDGKEGITEWQMESYQNYITADGKLHKTTRITYIPHTGRTHQLRLVSSHKKGFNLPIIGDTLYGIAIPGQRLLLHSKEIEFKHPTSGKPVKFTSKPEF